MESTKISLPTKRARRWCRVSRVLGPSETSVTKDAPTRALQTRAVQFTDITEPETEAYMRSSERWGVNINLQVTRATPTKPQSAGLEHLVPLALVCTGLGSG